VDLVKLDVEGHERAVLEGMRETLARFSPTLFMELLPRLAHDVAFVERLVADGYAFFLLTGDGPVRSERVQPSPRFRNVVLCRREADLAELAALAGAHGRPA
jgi:hypothetical protein